MKRYIKFAVLATVLMLSILLSGCLDAKVDGVISADNNVSLTYTLKFDYGSEEFDNFTQLKIYIDSIVNSWEDKGFEAEAVKEDTSITATCKMEQQCESREEAFEVLYGFLTNEISVFDEVEYSYSEDFYKEDYTITGKMDLSEVVESSIYENYPGFVGNSVDTFIENSTLTVNFDLPYNDSDVTGDVVQKAFSNEISFEDETEFQVVGVIKNFENAERERQVNATKADYEKKIKIAAIISGVLLLLLAAVIVLKIKSSKKSADEDPEALEAKQVEMDEKKAAKAKAKAEAKEAKKIAKEEKVKAKAAAKEAKEAAKAAAKEAKENIDSQSDSQE